jgi:hypothetical protein
MDDVTKQQLEADIKLANNMATLNSSTEIQDLTVRLISYLDLINSSEAQLLYQAALLKSKKNVLLEYIRVSKERAKALSIQEYQLNQNK